MIHIFFLDTPKIAPKIENMIWTFIFFCDINGTHFIHEGHCNVIYVCGLIFGT